ncbi:MAG: DUF1549 domain-containing protein [Leptolyngbya sp. PLA1]|nr:DUF1549 domain-containing protein [Leptolyngbya sp. PLA1]
MPATLTLLALSCGVMALSPAGRWAPAEPPVDIGPANPTCPVMEGEAVDPEVFTEYEGKRVYLCCKKCLRAFTENPAKYVGRLPQFSPPEPVTAEPFVGSHTQQLGADARVAARLFESNDPQVMAIRRLIRLGAVPPPAPPPAIYGPAWVHNEIDRFVVGAWAQAGLPEAERPPPVCDDATFARRVYLDVIGVVPTLPELRRFLESTSPEKRATLVDELLARHQDYADHWTPFWEDALGSTNVNNQGGVPGRGSYRAWINESFRTNKPFDVFAAELIDTTMPGAQKPMVAEANGLRTRTSYILNDTHTRTLQSAAAVGQVFLGTAMKCASCHNHFENAEWPQERFLSFAGMFAPADLEAIRCEVKSGRIVASGFPFEVPGAPAEVPVNEEERLRRVAALITDPANPRFSRSIVNRLWKRYLGLGLVEPADDARETIDASMPALLDWMAYDLASHDFDLKRTIRLILTSRTYQLRYDPALEDHLDLAAPGEPRWFRSPSLRRLTAEQMLDSAVRIAHQGLPSRDRLFRRNVSSSLTLALGRPASRNEISTGRPDAPAVVQLLELLNGDEFASLIYESPLTAEYAGGHRDLFLAALGREPLRAELDAAEAHARALARAERAESTEQHLFLRGTPKHGRLSGTWAWTEEHAREGERTHVQVTGGGPVQHYVLGLDEAPATYVRVWVRTDPADPPRELMLQVHSRGWEHRAFWGDDVIPFGNPGTTSRLRLGDLPRAGEWVQLEVRADAIGLGTRDRIEGFSFDQAGGRVWWGAVSLVRAPPSPGQTARGDLLWALLASPEFQYVH